MVIADCALNRIRGTVCLRPTEEISLVSDAPASRDAGRPVLQIAQAEAADDSDTTITRCVAATSVGV